jgi:hypothetical protein
VIAPAGVKMSQTGHSAAIGKFLKNFNQTAEVELEKQLRNALASGKILGHETFSGAVTLSIEKIDLNVTIYTKMEL